MLRDAQDRPWPRVLFALVALAALVGFFAYPTYPNYDSLYSLIWGREILHGQLPSFEVYRGPTEHPLALVFGALMSLFGTGGDRLMVFATLASYVALVGGLYRLAALAFTPLVGVITGALLISRFDFAFLAARGYIDIPYLALVVWAAALEAGGRRRGTPVFVLLGLAGLMRPEAWLLAGLYWLWYVWPATTPWRTRVLTALATGVAPVLWALTDGIVTGDPLYSLHSTSNLAEELGRSHGLSGVPHATWAFLTSLDKAPVVYAAVAGILLAILLVPRRLGMPMVLLIAGLGTFGLVGIAGLSIIDRYLLIPSLMVMIFAGVAFGGWTMLADGTARRVWAALFAVALVGGTAYTIANLNMIRFENELEFRERYRGDLMQVLDDPRVQAAMKCGPISTPNHKLIPDVRWITKLEEDQVIARSDRTQRRRIRRGVALYVTQRYALVRQAFVTPLDDPETQLPMKGFDRVVSHGYYGAYVRCPG
jgi:hypothetical protein